MDDKQDFVNTIKALGDEKPLEVGWHRATIAYAVTKKTKSGDGKYLYFRFLTPDNQVIHCPLTIEHPKISVVEYNLFLFRQLKKALELGDSPTYDDFIGKTCDVLIGKNRYGSIDVKNFRKAID